MLARTCGVSSDHQRWPEHLTKDQVDHVLFGLSVKVNLQGAGSLNDPAYNAQATQSYLQNATGILTSAGFDYIGWEKLPKDYRSNFTNRAENDLTSFPPDWPEIEYVTGDGSMPPTADSILTFLATLVAPTSRGNVTITSADTQDLPVVNPNWLSNPTDIEVAVAAFKRAREILGAKAFQPITLGPVQPIEEQVSTDEQIRSFVRQTASYVHPLDQTPNTCLPRPSLTSSNYRTLYHASCTCKSYQYISKSPLTKQQVRWESKTIPWPSLILALESMV